VYAVLAQEGSLAPRDRSDRLPKGRSGKRAGSPQRVRGGPATVRWRMVGGTPGVYVGSRSRLACSPLRIIPGRRRAGRLGSTAPTAAAALYGADVSFPK
jgi:hypothetical protein